MSEVYKVTHTNVLGVLKIHVLNYLGRCKEEGYNILDIKLCVKHPTFILSWPSKEEIISNGYEDIIIHVTCDATNFHCTKFIIGGLDDSYYDINNIHEDKYETIPSICLKNITGDIMIHNCCSFYTRIIINAPHMQSLIVRGVSYVDYLQLEYCADMYMIQLRDGSFINKLKLYKCIIEYGIVECGVSTHGKDKYKDNKSTVNEIEAVLSMIFSYTIPRFSSNFEIGGVTVDTVIEPIKLKGNDNIKISSKQSMIIEE